MKISGNIVDVIEREIFPGEISLAGGRIAGIRRLDSAPSHFVLPGFVDAHVHIESSMLPPSEFARLAVVHGTVATVSDPHEIANVLGVEGVRWMIENAKSVPFKIFFGAPSCVPATSFESAGAVLSSAEVDALLADPDISYLSEMMNFPGVLNGDAEVLAKLESAKRYGKVIDGHAPGLRGEAVQKYASHGISSDHECFTAEEARDKIAAGMKIIIREGSAAKNFDALIALIDEFPDRIMFCSDDKHPNDLILGHVNQLVVRALKRGHDRWNVLRAATLNPVKHYSLAVGLLQTGDPADFIVIDNFENFNILTTYISGKEVSSSGSSNIPKVKVTPINNFSCKRISEEEIQVPENGKNIRVIEALPGQLITKEKHMPALITSGRYESDPARDILKLLVLNRYRPAPPAVAFVSGFGFHSGAIASTVAHDSHNIVAVGTNDAMLKDAINLLVEHEGGISLVSAQGSEVLPLPIAGLMSAEDGYQVASLYESLDRKAKELGSRLPAPFMTLSFLALLVIPELKLSDLGLFDGKNFQFTSLGLP